MANYTNKHNVPPPLFNLLNKDRYSRGRSHRSATQLLDSAKLVALKEKHADKIVEDISDRVWALFGTAVHKMIEEGAPGSEADIVEERVFSEMEGWTISGAADRQLLENGRAVIWDWKVTRTWSVMGPPKREWENQLNLLAYLIEKEKGIEVDSLRIGALLRDWTRSEADRRAGYPPSPIHVVPIPLWSFAEREAYVRERVRQHQEAEIDLATGEELRECTEDEMWAMPERWAVHKAGQAKAYRVFDTEAEAKEVAKAIGKATIIHRHGRRVRCELCPVSRWCDQHEEFKRSQNKPASKAR